MIELDDLRAVAEGDPGGMRERIAELPRQCREAWTLAGGLEVDDAYRRVSQVAILGMGGSAIGGALLAGLVADECRLPIVSVAGYDLPAHVGPDTLALASSYSGDTEETLSACAQALERGCRLVAVTTGGRLAALAEQERFPLLRFQYPASPRASLGYSLVLLLGLFCRLGLLRDYGADLEEAATVMESWQQEIRPEVEMAHNAAKFLAARLFSHLPMVYGAGFLSAVARRWKGQFNENSKQWAFWEELPELNHNAVVGYALPSPASQPMYVIMLRSSFDHRRVQTRWEVTQELLQQAGVAHETIWGRGQCRLAQMLSLIHFGDYVSLYLALLNEADPSPVPPIVYLKRRLAEMP